MVFQLGGLAFLRNLRNVLILFILEDGFSENFDKTKEAFVIVLILFILEDGFSVIREIQRKSGNSSLNPFYSGRWFFSGDNILVVCNQGWS